MKIIVTGAHGNLGSAIVQRCAHQTTAIDRDTWPQIEQSLAAGADAVIHAAYDLQGRPDDQPSSIMEANVATTMTLLEAMRRHQTPRLIFISSCAVYGESMLTAEDGPRHPISINGIVKLLNEKVIEAFCSRYGIRYEIYRLFNMYGGNDRFSIIKLLQKAVRSGTPFRLNNGGVSQRDFIHVDDIARIIVRLLDTDHAFRHINIGTGRSTRIADIVDIAKRKYPELRIEHSRISEAEYSRADVSRLISLFPLECIDVRQFVQDAL